MKEVNNQEKLLNSVYKCLLCLYFTCNKRDFERHYANAQEHSGPPSP